MLAQKINRFTKVGFFGVGSSNLSLLHSLPLENCEITIRSDKPIDKSKLPSGLNIGRIFEGSDATQDIDEEIIFFSPSVRRDRSAFIEAKKRGVIFSSDTELFFEGNNKPIFAVTGSDGKSTTTAMITALLNEDEKTALALGNIGAPMYESLSDNMDFCVWEASSFMLSYVCPVARRACLTNLTPNHLDWHLSFEEYKKTKINLLKSSNEFVVSEENENIVGAFGIIAVEKSFSELRRSYPAELYITIENGYIMRNGEALISLDDVKDKKLYNLKNLMMAIAMTEGFVDKKTISSVAGCFTPPSHRCELVTSHGGIDFYDSSIDTSPARTKTTLSSLGKRCVIILGGKDKGLNFQDLVPEVQNFCECAVLVGECKTKIHSDIGGLLPCYIAENFESAVRLGAELAKSCGTLLLSPAAASYDEFENYKERGKKFKEIIQNLYNYS